jgi:uncharacterized protein YbjT (DUF2867 family)
MSTTLVTGGTHGLGVPTVDRLQAAGHDVRVLSRRAGPGRYQGDLATGTGLDDALDGSDIVVHLATSRRKDIGQTRNLLAAAKRAGIGHLVFISIVGVDRVPYGYYRDKVASEHAIAASGIPFTILRATQFHSFVAALFRLRLPVLPAPAVPVQSIATEEVAALLAELASNPPAGRVPDIGGPEILSVREYAERWNRAQGTKKPILTVRIPGKIIGAFKEGHHLAGLPGYGTQTFAEYAAAQASPRSAPR